ncbi:MAG: ribose 5-phosphate isomerase B [Planctomycetota bacterium]|nr:MAG: ribose 5-phosphate isomerase B [Planctomycetota bacterium]
MYNPNPNDQIGRDDFLVYQDKLLDAQEVRQLRNSNIKKIQVAPHTIITPLARDVAFDLGIQIEVASPSEIEDSGPPKIVALGADHGGYDLKEFLKEELKQAGYEILDVGTHSKNSVDYPDFAFKVAVLVAGKKACRGIMIDGVGIGSTMMANKVMGVRAANCHNLFEIKNSRRHNNANYLCIGGQTLGKGLAKEMVLTWLKEPFEGGRHARRVNKINDLEKGIPPFPI